MGFPDEIQFLLHIIIIEYLKHTIKPQPVTKLYWALPNCVIKSSDNFCSFTLAYILTGGRYMKSSFKQNLLMVFISLSVHIHLTRQEG